MRSLFSPLLPDDYLELVNPLWSTQELRGRIERIERETDSAVTVFIRPGYDWPGHKPGQYRAWAWSWTASSTGARTRSLRSPTTLRATSRSRPSGSTRVSSRRT